MLFAKKKFRSKCINNKFMDFGSHTGFNHKERYYSNLVVGQWYEFEVDEYGNACIIDPSITTRFNGTFFISSINHKWLSPHVDFYVFFESLEEMRTNSINDILGD